MNRLGWKKGTKIHFFRKVSLVEERARPALSLSLPPMGSQQVAPCTPQLLSGAHAGSLGLGFGGQLNAKCNLSYDEQVLVDCLLVSN